MSLLSDALSKKLIPWSRQNAHERFLVARKKMRAAQMPDGVKLTQRKVEGSRVIVKNDRLYDNTRGLRARWPEAMLGEWEQPKLTCLLTGQIDLQLGNYAVECGSGIYIIIPPHIPAPIEPYFATTKSTFEALNLYLFPHAIQCFISHHEKQQSRSMIRENYLFKNQHLVMLFRLLVDEMIDTQHQTDAIGNEIISIFWKILQRDVNKQRYINPGPIGRPIVRPEGHPEFEAELLLYIQTHLNGPLKLADAARGLYLSRTQFIRQMRQQTGKTYIQYLTDYRIAEAKVLLRDSDWTVTAIAGFLGFSDPDYFQLLFRRKTEKTPSQYRKSIRLK